jgi:hypothetical protein
MARFSQMPTLGEFIARARQLGWVRTTIRIRGIGQLTYLKRNREGTSPALVDLPPMRENDRLTRNDLESLCERTGVPREDSGPG